MVILFSSKKAKINVFWCFFFLNGGEAPKEWQFFSQKHWIEVILQPWNAYNHSYTHYLCASISHWLGNFSKLPNQCTNISNILRQIWKLPNQCSKLPNQCEMLAHIYSASISHWLGSSQIFGFFLALFEKKFDTTQSMWNACAYI